MLLFAVFCVFVLGCSAQNETFPPDPIDRCEYVCAAIYAPVCATNGETFSNICQMQRGQCLQELEENALPFEYDCDGECPCERSEPEIEGNDERSVEEIVEQPTETDEPVQPQPIEYNLQELPDWVDGEMSNEDQILVGSGSVGELLAYAVQVQKGESLLAKTTGGFGDVDLFLCPNELLTRPESDNISILFFLCDFIARNGNEEIEGTEALYTGYYIVVLTSLQQADQEVPIVFQDVTLEITILPNEPIPCVMTLDYEFSEISDEDYFSDVFVDDICGALSTRNAFDCSRIVVAQILEGSVQVYFTVLAPLNDDPPNQTIRITAVLTLQDQLEQMLQVNPEDPGSGPELSRGYLTQHAVGFNYNIIIPDPPQGDGDSIEVWLIGVIVAAVVVFIIFVIVVYCCCCRKKKEDERKMEASGGASADLERGKSKAIVPAVELSESNKQQESGEQLEGQGEGNNNATVEVGAETDEKKS